MKTRTNCTRQLDISAILTLDTDRGDEGDEGERPSQRGRLRWREWLRWRGGLGQFENVLDWSWVFCGNEGTFWGNLGWFWDVLGGSWEIFSRVIEGRFGTIQVIRGHNRMLLACSRVFWGWFGGDLGTLWGDLRSFLDVLGVLVLRS